VVEQVTRTGNSTTKTPAVISDPVTGTPLMLRTDTGNQNMYIYDGAPGAPGAPIDNINGQLDCLSVSALVPYTRSGVRPRRPVGGTPHGVSGTRRTVEGGHARPDLRDELERIAA
jgi:hypothetical protein